MGDSAAASSSSTRTPTERDLRMKVSLQRVHTSFDQAVNIVLDELITLQADHAQLQAQHLMLVKEHKELQEEYKTERETWKKFTVWWKDAAEKKKVMATQQTPGRQLASSPLTATHQTPGAPTASNGKGKGRMTRAELEMFTKVGIDCSDFVTPTVEQKEPVSMIKIKREDEEVSEVRKTPMQSTSPMERIQSRLEGASYSEERTKKRLRSSAATQDCSSPSRRVLTDIGNRSISDEPSEEHDCFSKGSIVDSIKKKGKGRYSTTRSGDTSRTINEEYEVDPDRNGNVCFLHKSVVRDKAERKQMHAHDCECCSEYYKVVGDAPLRRYEDPRRLAVEEHNEEDGSADEGERKRQSHRQQISRHRGYGPPASTPPGYWDTAFPSTQKLDEINRLAREEHAKKRDQIARDPRFKKRM